jgi:hypothetical protein
MDFFKNPLFKNRYTFYATSLAHCIHKRDDNLQFLTTLFGYVYTYTKCEVLISLNVLREITISHALTSATTVYPSQVFIYQKTIYFAR